MNEELDIAAAEYVLGTLPADERARLASRLEQEPELREAVERWQSRLRSLDEAVPPEAPPDSVWRGIERATAAETRFAGARPTGAPSAAAADGGDVVQLRRRLAVWRAAALVGGALAAGFAGIALLDRVAAPADQAGSRYVAVVDTGGREPAMIAEVDTATGLIRVRSLAAETPAGQSLELWHIAEGHEPRSLGVLQAGAGPQTIQDVATEGPVDGVIAVTVEPEGGSPSGAPTGPVVYSGRLIAVE